MSTDTKPHWKPATIKPPYCDPLLVVGVLEMETFEAVHEGFWNGRRFLSVRGDDGANLRIQNARAWRLMPEPPKPEEVESEPLTTQGGRDKERPILQ